MSQKYKIVDLSGGMNVIESDYNIALKESVLLRNMTTEGNKAITLPGFTKYFGNGDDGQVQGGATNGSSLVYIHNNNLYYYNKDTGSKGVYNNAVGVGIKGTESDNEDYNIIIYKKHIIITNSMKSGVSILQCEGESPKLFEIMDENNCNIGCNKIEYNVELSKQEFKCLREDVSPITAIVDNGILYFGGGIKGSGDENLIYWGGLEFLEVEYEGTMVSRSRIFDFCRVLSADLNDGSDLGNPIPGGEYVGDGEPITSFFSNGDQLYIGKRNSIYRAVPIFDRDNTVYTGLRHSITKSTDTGIKNQEVVHNIHGNTIYFDGTHIRILSYDRDTSTLEDNTLSKPIQPIINNFTNNQNFATSAYTYPLLKFFLRDSDKQYGNNVALVYNVEEKSWSMQDGINLFHAWSGYDSNSDKVQGFWGSDSSNIIFQDGIGNTWGDEPRTFEFLGRMYNFGDSVSYKTISKVNFSLKVGPDVDLSFKINTLKVRKKLVTKHSGKISKYKSKNIVKNTTTATGVFGGSQFGSYGEYNTDNTNSIHFPMTMFQTGKGFQPHILGEGYGYFEIQYMDLYISANELNNHIS